MHCPYSNDASHWREFDKNRVSHSAAHYLMAIQTLRKDLGYARVSDAAARLEVTRGAASLAVTQLKKKGLITEDPHRFLLLTAEGERVATEVERNFSALVEFLEKMLGVPSETARADACKMEHLMSLDTGRRLLWLMRFILSDPQHAEMIRSGMSEFQSDCPVMDDCLFSDEADFSAHEACRMCGTEVSGGAGGETEALNLRDAPAGKAVRVTAVVGGSEVQARLRSTGIRPGVLLTKLGSGMFGYGPTVVKHGQTQTALGPGICRKILVEIT